ncbi:hypothetical protein, partial [Streptomyces sp. SID3343]|uniref:hypothetical protein n=1 Tax=Streptomyces sp. SID3343 TaxID=2690260 RepID=UPI001F4878B9
MPGACGGSPGAVLRARVAERLPQDRRGSRVRLRPARLDELAGRVRPLVTDVAMPLDRAEVRADAGAAHGADLQRRRLPGRSAPAAAGPGGT